MFPKASDLFKFDDIRLSRAAKIFLQEIRDPDLLGEFREVAESGDATKYVASENLYVTNVSGYRVVWRPSEETLDVIVIIADKPLD